MRIYKKGLIHCLSFKNTGEGKYFPLPVSVLCAYGLFENPIPASFRQIFRSAASGGTAHTTSMNFPPSLQNKKFTRKATESGYKHALNKNKKIILHLGFSPLVIGSKLSILQGVNALLASADFYGIFNIINKYFTVTDMPRIQHIPYGMD